jgi:hypothetical protein
MFCGCLVWLGALAAPAGQVIERGCILQGEDACIRRDIVEDVTMREPVDITAD